MKSCFLLLAVALGGGFATHATTARAAGPPSPWEWELMRMLDGPDAGRTTRGKSLSDIDMQISGARAPRPTAQATNKKRVENREARKRKRKRKNSKKKGR